MRHGHAVKRTLIASLFTLLAFAACVSLPGTAKLGLGGPAMAGGDYAIDQFYGALAPHGEWVYHPRYNYVWLPRAVDQGWRPYSVGQWRATDEYGWYWDSYEPFAWAVYHYGRWGYEYEYGWYWVPGDTWAPAWVRWRYGTDYVGWAPVGPSAYGGYAYGGPARYDAAPRDDSWIFVRQAYLTSNVLNRHVVPRSNLTIALSHTTYVVRPQYRNGRVYNYGMPRDRWSRITHQRVQSHRIHRGNHRKHVHGAKGRRRGRDLHVYAPGVRKGVKPRHAPKIAHRKPHHAKGKANANARNRARAHRRAAVNRRPHRRNTAAGASRGRPGHSAGANVKRRGVYAPLMNNAAKAKAARDRAAISRAGVNTTRRGVYAPLMNNAAKAKAARDRAANAKAANAKAHANRAKANKAKANRAKAIKAKLNKANAHRGQPNLRKAAKPRSPNARPANAAAAKARAANAKAAKARAANARAANQRAAKARAHAARAAHAKAVNARAASAKPAKAKSAKSRSANAKPSGRGSGSGGRAKKGGHRGGGRGSACKANPNLPNCGRRGG